MLFIQICINKTLDLVFNQACIRVETTSTVVSNW